MEHDPCPRVGGAPKTQLDVAAWLECRARASGSPRRRDAERRTALVREPAFADCRPRERALSPRVRRARTSNSRSAVSAARAFDSPAHSAAPPAHAPQRKILDERKVQRQSFALPVFGHESDLRRQLCSAARRRDSSPRARGAARAVPSLRRRRFRGSPRREPRGSRPEPPRLRARPAPRRASGERSPGSAPPPLHGRIVPVRCRSVLRRQAVPWRANGHRRRRLVRSRPLRRAAEP